MTWLQEQKDNSVGFVIRKLLQQKLEPYGDIQSFELDSKSNTLSIKILLKGEMEPISLLVDEYEMRHEPSGTFFIIHRASASREWISRLLSDFLLGKPLAVPPEYASIARKIL